MNKKILCAMLAAVLSGPAHADNTWQAVNNNDLTITAGGPLDFSNLSPSDPAGSSGRVIAKNGRLVFANNDTVPAKLQCGSISWSPASGSFPDHDTATLYAQQLKRHGYNLVRLMYVEGILMHLRTQDNSYDPVQLERFYYFLNELKKQGIYWMIDMLSSENGSLGDNESNRWVSRKDLKFRVQIEADTAARQAWQDQVYYIFAQTNPYTGMSTLSDPALAGVVLVNEGEINYLAQQKDANGNAPTTYKAVLKPLFNAYLSTRFASDTELATAWKTGDGVGVLRSDEHLSSQNIDMPPLGEQSLRMKTFQEFLAQLEVNTTSWMKNYLRSHGYQGVVSSYSNWLTITANKMRAAVNPAYPAEPALDLIDTHSYFNEVLTFAEGTTVKQVSMTDPAYNSINPAFHLAAARHAGKPFSVTEYGQVFWNQYRFEASAMVPATAALQGWDFMCMHAEGAIDLKYDAAGPSRKRYLGPYEIGLDPVLRAGETLSALLYLRGDVAPSPNRATVTYPSLPGEQRYDSGNAVSPALRMLGLITGLEIKHSEETATPALKNISFQPAFSNTIAARIADLKASTSGILAITNLSDDSLKLYQSDTEQLLLDQASRRFTIKTPRTEVLTTAVAASNVNLNTFKVQSIDNAALLSASTLNDGNLDASKKVLIIFATDAENSGMTFSDSKREVLKYAGTLPVRIRPGEATASLQLKHKAPMRLWALDLKGDRTREIPTTQVESADGIEWQFVLRNTDTAAGPTTFFLLEEAL